MPKRLFLILVTLHLAACSQSRVSSRDEYQQAKPDNALASRGIEKVAVVILNATDTEVDVEEVAQIFSVELRQFKGVKVFPAEAARAAVINQQLRLPEQAHVLGRKLGVDAVIVGFITDYEPHDYPRLGVLLMVYPAAKEDETACQARVLASVNRIYDSNNEDVLEQVRAYAAHRDAQDTPPGDLRHLVVTNRYMHFVADRSIRDLFADAERWGLTVAQAE